MQQMDEPVGFEPTLCAVGSRRARIIKIVSQEQNYKWRSAFQSCVSHVVGRCCTCPASSSERTANSKGYSRHSNGYSRHAPATALAATWQEIDMTTIITSCKSILYIIFYHILQKFITSLQINLCTLAFWPKAFAVGQRPARAALSLRSRLRRL